MTRAVPAWCAILIVGQWCLGWTVGVFAAHYSWPWWVCLGISAGALWLGVASASMIWHHGRVEGQLQESRKWWTMDQQLYP